MKKKQTLTGILVMILAIALDQLTKQWAVEALKGKESLVLIKGVLEFSYLENTGGSIRILPGTADSVDSGNACDHCIYGL